MPAKRLLIKRFLVIALASVVILAGLLVGGVRLIDHLMPHYRQALAERLGDRIDADISIAAIELRWQWRGPQLLLNNVSIQRHGESQPAVTMDSLGLHFSFLDLVHGKRRPDGLAVDAPRLALRLGDDNRPDLVHWSRPDDPPLGWDVIRSVRAMLHSAQIDDAQIELVAPTLPGGRALLDPVSIRWHDEDDRLEWQARADGPDWFEHIAGSGQFTGPLPDVQSADFELELGGIETLELARAFGRLRPDLAERLSGGRLSAHVSATMAQSRFDAGQADIELTAIEDSQHDQPLLPALAATLKAAGPSAASAPGNGNGNDFSFIMSKLVGDLPGLANFSLTGAVDTGTPAITINARHPPTAVALRLARLFYPRLAETDLTATVDNLSLAAGVGTPFAIGFDFRDLAIANPQITLGPLAGHYSQHGDDHRLQFHNAGGTLAIAHYLRGKLALDDLDGGLSWRNGSDGWDIAARELTLTSGDATLAASGRIHLPAHGAPVVDLKANASAPAVVRLLAHIPQAGDLPNKRLRDWLPKAIKAGRLQSATLVLAGPLNRFPFAEPQSGERFHLTLHGSGVDVAYKPDWPPLQQARGTLTLDGTDLQVDVASARMLDVTLGPSSGHVPDVREPLLQIDGKASRERADKMLAFLSQSPLRDKFAKVVDAITLTGPADLALDLRIPLKPGLGKVEVKGAVTGHGNTLRQKALPGPITDITGRVTFDQAGLTGRNLHGKLLGLALTTDLTPQADKSQRIVSDATLQLPRDTDAIAHYLPRAWLRYGQGKTAIRVDFAIARNGKVSDVTVDSDLVGLALALPTPLTKAPATPAPLTVTVRGDAKRVGVDYDQRLNVAVRLAQGKPTRVQALLNAPDRPPPDVDGIWIGGHTPALDGIGWFHVVRDQLNAAAKARKGRKAGANALAFLGGNLTIGALNLDKRYFENAQLRAQPMAANPGWRVDFEGPDTQGQVTWTQPAGGRVDIAGNLARLALKTRPPTGAREAIKKSPLVWASVSPNALPRLDVNVSKVLVDKTDFGHASVQAKALFNGWQLDRLQLSDGALTGWAAGRWLSENGMTQADAQTHIDGHGIAGLLRTLGYAPTVRARDARIDARLTIASNPNGLDLRRLDGHVGLALDNGTLVSVEPGAARVLGLVNLYVLPRRLRMDFRDVVDKGLAFDSLRADFNISNGNAYSDNVHIDTTSSKIEISGRIGLAAHDYDERVTVAPKVGSSVAIASGVLGGPLVGAAVLAFQELFKKPIQKFSSIAYTLKGSWDDPQIEQPSAED